MDKNKGRGDVESSHLNIVSINDTTSTDTKYDVFQTELHYANDTHVLSEITGFMYDMFEGVPHLIGLIDERKSETPHLIINLNKVKYIDITELRNEKQV